MKLIIINKKDPNEIIEDVKSGKIHVICVAENSFTHLNVYAELMLNFSRTDINNFVELSNSRSEVGTLFPKAYLSILPIGNIQSDDKLSFYVEEIFTLNQQYLKSEILFFSLEDSFINKEIIFKIIENKIQIEKNNNLFVKEIWLEN
jgi:hypothetical protein